MTERVTPVAHPAATVVIVRDGERGCEVLLVRRNSQLAFHGGAWVFPGGRLDPEDYAGLADATDVVAAARNAAMREAREEAGVDLVAESLVAFARWVTPVDLPKRFDTWFFAGLAAHHDVRVDGGEIHDHRWMHATEALAAQRGGEIELPPPTFVTLTGLAPFQSAADALRGLREQPFETFLPRLHLTPDGACTLYGEDAGYESGDIDQPGPRHRLSMRGSEWVYERVLG
jgi:8-oxo-dGTP pyrophosphatase MutT (NUDIX family)